MKKLTIFEKLFNRDKDCKAYLSRNRNLYINRAAAKAFGITDITLFLPCIDTIIVDGKEQEQFVLCSLSSGANEGISPVMANRNLYVDLSVVPDIDANLGKQDFVLSPGYYTVSKTGSGLNSVIRFTKED